MKKVLKLLAWIPILGFVIGTLYILYLLTIVNKMSFEELEDKINLFPYTFINSIYQASSTTVIIILIFTLVC